MTKRFTRTAELLRAYTSTPATAKTLALQFGVCRDTVNHILKANLDPKAHEKLKARKLSQSMTRANLIRYRLRYGL